MFFQPQATWQEKKEKEKKRIMNQTFGSILFLDALKMYIFECMKILRPAGILPYQISQIQRLEELKSILKYFHYSEVVSYNVCAFRY